MSRRDLSSQPFAPAMEAGSRINALRERLEKPGLVAVVVGAGKSGKAAALLLLDHGAQVTVVDDKDFEAIPGTKSDKLSAEILAAADLVILSPGVPRKRPELAEAIAANKLVGEIELASWFVKAPLIGITNGKSTTTALTAHLIASAGKKVFAGGNLGEPLSTLARSREQVDVAVVELSSYQLESIVDARFHVACWLNLTPDHLDRYVDAAEYGAAKKRLIESRSANGTAVLNAKDPACAAAGIQLGGRVRWFAADSSSDLAGPFGTILRDPETAIRTWDERTEAYDLRGAPSLLGLHNKANAIAAIECARHFELPADAIQNGLRTFRGLPHRLELIREVAGVRYYNDSKATNIDSSITGVAALPGPIILIVGGKDKGAPWAPLVEAGRGKVKAVLAIGAATPIVLAAYRGHADVLEDAGTIELAITRAKSLAKPGDQVLLSPACASFDQFKNYEHRGETFRRLVEAL
jgi:UDP-N-acetylmuramoylalanine--D-glutamate ligase